MHSGLDARPKNHCDWLNMHHNDTVLHMLLPYLEIIDFTSEEVMTKSLREKRHIWCGMCVNCLSFTVSGWELAGLSLHDD